MSLKMRSVLIFTIILTLICTTSVFGAESRPSTWAEEEVNEAISNNLVHESLRNSYQTPIKRYEYVLLALDVLALQGVQPTIKQEYVFDDILGHPYEKEILKAYYAGIISGYGNGLFKPDELITREEVAALVVKLLKRIDKESNISGLGSINYSDINSISSWAKESVNYCYANKILKGVGKDNKGLDIIRPKGTATREESILLLYRLAKVEEVITSGTFGTITIDPNNLELPSEKEPGETFDLSYFSRMFSDETAEIILSLENSEEVAIIDVTNEVALLAVNNVATIYLVRYDEGISLELYSPEPISDYEREVYLDLLRSINENETIIDEINEGITNLNLTQASKDESIAGRFFIYMRMDETDNYLVKYFEKLF